MSVYIVGLVITGCWNSVLQGWLEGSTVVEETQGEGSVREATAWGMCTPEFVLLCFTRPFGDLGPSPDQC
jgi:hypothetical protein